MSMNDPIADMIARINNGQRARHATVDVPASGLLANILTVLKDEGYIADYTREAVRKGVDTLKVQLKYFEGEPVIKQMKRISTPGRRDTRQVKNLPKVGNGLGISIVSTSKGVMSDHKAREEKVGGEVLCSVF